MKFAVSLHKLPDRQIDGRSTSLIPKGGWVVKAAKPTHQERIKTFIMSSSHSSNLPVFLYTPILLLVYMPVCLRLHNPSLVSVCPPAEPGHLSCCVCCTHVWICLAAHMPAALPPCQQYQPEYYGILCGILQTCPVSIVYSMCYIQMFIINLFALVYLF